MRDWVEGSGGDAATAQLQFELTAITVHLAVKGPEWIKRIAINTN